MKIDRSERKEALLDKIEECRDAASEGPAGEMMVMPGDADVEAAAGEFAKQQPSYPALKKATPKFTRQLGQLYDDRPGMLGVPKYVFWTGGFDSTSILLSHFHSGHSIQPVYMKHSPSTNKCALEKKAQGEIWDYLGKPGNIMQPVVWDIMQLASVTGAQKLWDTLDELAEALGISRQYSALRFCRDITGFQGTIELGIVAQDELWDRWEFGPKERLGAFFKGFHFPLLNTQKREIWQQASPADRAVLKMTVSCEESDKLMRTCRMLNKPFHEWCGPCRRRIEEMTQ